MIKNKISLNIPKIFIFLSYRKNFLATQQSRRGYNVTTLQWRCNDVDAPLCVCSVETHKRVRISHCKRAIGVRVIEVLL